jgi:hypothetical protein
MVLVVLFRVLCILWYTPLSAVEQKSAHRLLLHQGMVHVRLQGTALQVRLSQEMFNRSHPAMVPNRRQHFFHVVKRG